MSTLCEIYIAAEADGPHLAHLDLKNITPIELSTLWDLAAGREISEEGMDRFETASEIEGESVTVTIPVEFCEELTRLKQGDLAAVTAAWAETDEIQADPADIQPLIEDLVNIAEASVSLGTPLWLKILF